MQAEAEDHGLLLSRDPLTPRVMIGAHVGGVAKEDLRSFPLRKGFDPRVFLVEPLLDQGLVALLRAVQRLLASDAESPVQQSSPGGAFLTADILAGLDGFFQARTSGAGPKDAARQQRKRMRAIL